VEGCPKGAAAASSGDLPPQPAAGRPRGVAAAASCCWEAAGGLPLPAAAAGCSGAEGRCFAVAPRQLHPVEGGARRCWCREGAAEGRSSPRRQREGRAELGAAAPGQRPEAVLALPLPLRTGRR
jgi:hypothetical protein